MSFLRRMLGLTPDSPIHNVGATAVAPAPTRKTNTNNPNLPQKAQDKLPALLRRIEEVLARAEADEAAAEIVQLQRMRDDHLEKVLGAYLEIPKEHLAEIYLKTGKSASFHLNDAIDKMAGKLEEISRTLAADKINVFADNASFVISSYDNKADGDDGNFFLEGLK